MIDTGEFLDCAIIGAEIRQAIRQSVLKRYHPNKTPFDKAQVALADAWLIFQRENELRKLDKQQARLNEHRKRLLV